MVGHHAPALVRGARGERGAGVGDRHQFRFIVSPEDGDQYEDLKPLTRRLMERMGRNFRSAGNYLETTTQTLKPNEVRVETRIRADLMAP